MAISGDRDSIQSSLTSTISVEIPDAVTTSAHAARCQTTQNTYRQCSLSRRRRGD